MEIGFGSFTVNPLLRESYWSVITHSEADLVSNLKKPLFVFSTAWNLLFKNSYYELAHEIQLKSFLFSLNPASSSLYWAPSSKKIVEYTIMPVIMCYVIFIALQFITNVFMGGTKYLNRF